MNNYTHISLYEREMMWKLKSEGLSYRKIGMVLRRKHTTISQEFDSHTKYLKEYVPCKAQVTATNTARNQRQKARLNNPTTYLYVRTKLREHQWSLPYGYYSNRKTNRIIPKK